MQLHPVLGLVAFAIVQVGVRGLNFEVQPNLPTMYFPVSGLVTFSCTATLPDGQKATDLLTQISVSPENMKYNATYCLPGNAIQNRTSAYDWCGGVCNSSLNVLQPNKVQCTFFLNSIVDGNYVCTVAQVAKTDVVSHSFNMSTAKKPDEIYLSNEGETKVTIIDIEEGKNKTVNCTSINSKPAYLLSWNTEFGHTSILSTEKDSTGFTNATISLFITGNRSINGTELKCTGQPPERIDFLDPETVSATFNVAYGPDDNFSNVTFDSGEGTVTCPLTSNPPITSFNWSSTGMTINCTNQNCSVGRSSKFLDCNGTNPKTRKMATGFITIIWKDVQSSEKERPGDSDGLTAEVIAGITIAVVVAMAVISTILIVYTKCIRSKRSIASKATHEDNKKEDVYAKPDRSRNVSTKRGQTEASRSDLAMSNENTNSTESARISPTVLTATYAQIGENNSIDSNPRSRKPIAMSDLSDHDMVPNQIYAS